MGFVQSHQPWRKIVRGLQIGASINEKRDTLYISILYQPIGHDAQLQQVSAPSPEFSGPYRCLGQIWLQVEIGLAGREPGCRDRISYMHLYDLGKTRSRSWVLEDPDLPLRWLSSLRCVMSLLFTFPRCPVLYHDGCDKEEISRPGKS
jgi:hypothetical protein